ncbi:hypothetical protein BC835DRAFT_1303864 [Cytidiella melzeri]|nr:hypothetical protein BC835DRAFT_1303864 [Cytidiella melzeri]
MFNIHDSGIEALPPQIHEKAVRKTRMCKNPAQSFLNPALLSGHFHVSGEVGLQSPSNKIFPPACRDLHRQICAWEHVNFAFSHLCSILEASELAAGGMCAKPALNGYTVGGRLVPFGRQEGNRGPDTPVATTDLATVRDLSTLIVVDSERGSGDIAGDNPRVIDGR